MTEQKLHVAIIPDGNRRWAKAHSLFPWKGHEKSAENFRSLLEYAHEDGRIGTLTFWCFSTENWKRDEKEVSKIMTMLENYLKNERSRMIEKGIRLVHSGRRDRLSANLLELMDEICEATKSGTSLILNLAIDYGGKDELLRAVEKLHDAKPTEESIRAHLDHPELPDIDLIIRTSGEQRTSNFFLWQSTYAEWMFIDMFFPEFTPEHLKTAIDTFSTRERRFGA